MSELYASNRTYHVPQQQMALLPNYYRWVYGWVRPHLHGTIVEVGCGAGHGIACYLGTATQIYAVDHDPVLIAAVRHRFSPAKVQAICADVTRAWDRLEHLRADAVLLMDVLEHLEDDRSMLAKSRSLLKRGGVVVLKVPAHRKLYGPMDQASGHYRRYDAADLLAVARDANLEPVLLRYINPVGALVYLAKKGRTTNFSRSFSPRKLNLINRGLPILRIFDRLALPLGLSIVAVFRAI